MQQISSLVGEVIRVDLRDLKIAAAIAASFIGFLLLPLTLNNMPLIFPSMLLIFIGLTLAIGAEQ